MIKAEENFIKQGRLIDTHNHIYIYNIYNDSDDNNNIISHKFSLAIF